ncbi:MAG: ferredoxin [Candidatus Kerfeldbacteria bacterium]|nr:ferredoxin [Candidatus Kerfeldbacteria bacterium]
MKIVLKRDKCISAATCVAIAPDVFELDEEGKVKLKNEHGADDQTIIDAARSCPTQAIEIYDDQGKQLVP